MTVRDLRVESPRRWSESVDGVRWLPRLIDKARAAQAGVLGGYLYGQSPIDRDMLRAAGCGHRTLAAIVAANSTDGAVLRALDVHRPGAADALRDWSRTLPRRYGALLFALDVDDGYLPGAWRLIKGPTNAATNGFTWLVKRVWPVRTKNASSS